MRRIFSDDNLFGVSEAGAFVLHAPESPPPMAAPAAVPRGFEDVLDHGDDFSADEDDRSAEGEPVPARDLDDHERRTLLEGGSVGVPIDGVDRLGRLRIIDMMDRQQIYAVCPIKEHGVCIKTRTCRAGPRTGAGRPAGFLGAWLKAGSACATHEEHMRVAVSLEQRRAAREEIKLAFRGQGLLDFEVAKKDADDSEPENSK